MGTNCCWQENEESPKNKKVNVNKPVEQKGNGKPIPKKEAVKYKDVKRKSYPLQNKKNKEDIKKDTEAQDKRSSTASFHSASSSTEVVPTLISNNSNIPADRYQG